MCSAVQVTHPQRRWTKWLVRLGAICIIAAVGVDYAAFHASRQRALAAVAALGGWTGGIGGWPLGQEIVISFERDLSDAEIARLAVVNDHPARQAFTIYFKGTRGDDPRAAHLRATFNRCQVQFAEPPTSGALSAH